MELGMFMAGSAHKHGVIQTVGFYLGDGGAFDASKGDVTAPFRIRIYAAEADGTPGEELTKDVLIVSAKKNDEWFDVDVSGYRVENPETGFVVAFVLLNREFYNETAAYKGHSEMVPGSEYIATPRLGLTRNEFKDQLSYIGRYSKNGFNWAALTLNYNYMIRASIGSY
jgi:hypothetical protein